MTAIKARVNMDRVINRVQQSVVDPPRVLPAVQSVAGCLLQLRDGIDCIESALAGDCVMSANTRNDIHCEMARSFNWLFDRIGLAGLERSCIPRIDRDATSARPPSIDHWNELAFMRLAVELIENVLANSGRMGSRDRARLQIEISLRLRWLVGQAEIQSGSAAFVSTAAIWEALVSEAVEYAAQSKAAKKRLRTRQKAIDQFPAYEKIQDIRTSIGQLNTPGAIRAVPVSLSEGVNSDANAL